MKKGYLYLVFIVLSSVVVLIVAVIFKLTTTTESLKKDTSIAKSDSGEMNSLLGVQIYEDSWIQIISKEKKEKEYLYPIQKFHIQFN